MDGVIKAVESGQTLETFASKWGGNTQSVIDANWIDSPFTVTEGQVLFVPNGRIPDPPKQTYYSAAISTPTYSSGDGSTNAFLSWPVASCRGVLTQWPSWGHMALDIADGSYPDLVAAADGTVVYAGCHSGNCGAYYNGIALGGVQEAWAVEIDHGNGYISLYGHMNAIYVTNGQHVSQGEVIGQMGQSGYASGIHVHFELWQGRKWNRVNPVPFFINGSCGKLYY
jgi:murein DD-endopeptidase MepM/ murein hydrolase activator NlpD